MCDRDRSRLAGGAAGVRRRAVAPVDGVRPRRVGHPRFTEAGGERERAARGGRLAGGDAHRGRRIRDRRRGGRR